MNTQYKPVSRLTVIFILVVIISGGLLTYFSINNIANLKELTEKKIGEEEQRIVTQLHESIRLYIEGLTTGFTQGKVLDLKNELFQKVIEKDSIVYPFILNNQANFIYPNFIRINDLIEVPNFSKQYITTFQQGERSEFNENNLRIAKNHYLNCLRESRNAKDSVKARNAVGRIAVKMKDKKEILDQYLFIITTYFSEVSESGIPYSYYAIQQIIQIKDVSDTQRITEAILFFVKKMDEGLIPLTFSTEGILNATSEWIKNNPSTGNNKISEIHNATLGIIRQMNFIDQYSESIQDVFENNSYKNIITTLNGFKAIDPITVEEPVLMLISIDSGKNFGYIIEGKPLAESLLIKEDHSRNEFDYVFNISEDKNALLANSFLTFTSQISPFFPNLLIYIQLQDESVIREYISTRSWIYGIAILLLLVGMFLGVFLILRDITREKHLARLRADFISNVTHELKTPLTSIYMFAESLLLGRVKQGKQKKEYLSVIIKESERLKRMINNILEFSKIERGKPEYHFSETNVSVLLGIVIDEMRYWIEEKQIQVITELEDIHMVMDREKMKQAFSNLLNNAIKYSVDSTRIFVRLYRNDRNMTVEIEDEGIGIPENKIPHIFEKFYRVEQPETESISGTGLGLTVVKEIVDAHKGIVLVESKPGTGSKFSIVLSINS